MNASAAHATFSTWVVTLEQSTSLPPVLEEEPDALVVVVVLVVEVSSLEHAPHAAQMARIHGVQK